MNRERAYWLDLWRGLAVLAMIFYHACYDLVVIYGIDWPAFQQPSFFYFQQSIGLSFSLTAGISLALSRHSLQHGLKIFILALVLTAGTLMLMPSQTILFGVLHMLGVSIVLGSFLKKFLEKIPAAFGLVLSFGMFLAFWPLASQSIVGNALNFLEGGGGLSAILGYPPPDFRSSDYYPLLPWFWAVLSGYFLKDFFPLQKKIGKDPSPLEAFLLLCGQKALPIYFLHQPVLLIILFPFGQM